MSDPGLNRSCFYCGDQVDPPAYTELIGHQLLAHVKAAACA